jgi:hypothetical protein
MDFSFLSYKYLQIIILIHQIYFNIFLHVFSSCLTIETIRDPDNPNEVEAVLKVNRIIHWEVFDTLYVNIIVEDRNTSTDYELNRNANGK